MMVVVRTWPARLLQVYLPMTDLEKFLDGITPSYVSDHAKELDEGMRAPFAQAMSVFLFSRLFTKNLNSCAQEFPEPLKTNWEFPHDRIFTEVVSFYFFVLLREYLGKLQMEDDENGRDDYEDDEEDGRLEDPYASSLVTAMSLASVLIHRYADFGPPKEFVRNRAFSYSLPTNKNNPVDLLERLIFKIWNPDKGGKTRLGISEPFLPIMTTIAAMPIEAVQKSCKRLYEDLARGHNTRVSPKTKTKPSADGPPGAGVHEISVWGDFTVWQKLIRIVVAMAILALPFLAVFILVKI